jgi:hypothetical protein
VLADSIVSAPGDQPGRVSGRSARPVPPMVLPRALRAERGKNVQDHRGPFA